MTHRELRIPDHTVNEAQEPDEPTGAPMTQNDPNLRDRITSAAPTDWIDGHPQLEAIAAAVWERCGRSDSGACVEDDPRSIAVAALAAVLPAPDQQAALARVRVLADEIDTEMRTETDTQRSAMQMEAVTRIRAALDGHPLRRLAGEARQDPHVCKPSAGYYYCPTSARVESDCHGSFDVCCDRPELHMPQREARQDPAPGGLAPVGGVKGNPFDYHPEDDEARYGQPETDGEA